MDDDLLEMCGLRQGGIVVMGDPQIEAIILRLDSSHEDVIMSLSEAGYTLRSRQLGLHCCRPTSPSGRLWPCSS